MPVPTWPARSLAIFAALLPLAACGSGAQDGGSPGAEVSQTGLHPKWFGGYLDVTLVPGLRLQDSPPQGAVTAVLSFVTAHPDRPCEPSWGGSYDLEQAKGRLDLDAQVDAFRKAGNDVAVSFGGQSGTELAVSCADTDALVDAYAAVITRYGLDIVDLDVEGNGAADPAAAQRRAAAMARLQSERPADNPLKVWLTLPVSASGLTPAAEVSVETMLRAGVELAGVNIMTMNFGPLRQGQTMLAASVSAAEGTHGTLKRLYEQAGKPLDDAALWNRIGLTPMIGRNDVQGQVFSQEDAHGLNTFALERGVGRMSMWSLNRDSACQPDNQGQSSEVSSNCSGLEQEPGMFAKVLGNSFTDAGSAGAG
ncbi:chitinase [Arthrobacter sp. D3-16]